MEMVRRIAEADASYGIRLPSPNPPSARVVYVHAAVPAPIATSPRASWARPFQLVLGVKTACTPFCGGFRLLLTPVDKSGISPRRIRAWLGRSRRGIPQ